MRLSSIFILIFGILFVLVGKSAFAAPKPADVRVLVDVSSSMGKRDPQNIRATTVRMLSRLLPVGSKISVWTFATKTETLVSKSIVDKDLLVTVDLASNRINAKGTHSDLATAFDIATKDWGQSNEENPRIVLVLTDGIIDVSENTLKNAESKEHVLQTIIPKMQRNNVKIFALGISNTVNKELLSAITTRTGGVYKNIEDTQLLQTVLIDMFKKVIKMEGFTIEKNIIKVADGAKEISIMFSKDKPNDKFSLVKPDGTIQTIHKHEDNISWIEKSSMELITLKQPVMGSWSLLGSLAKDTTISVINNLRVELPSFPQDIFSGEQVTVAANLMSGDDIITNTKFLQLIDFKAVVKNDGSLKHLPLQAIESKPGKYKMKLGPFIADEGYNLDLNFEVDGITFKHNRAQKVKINPVPIQFVQQASVDKKGEKYLFLELSLDEGVLLPGSTTIHANIQDDKDNSFSYIVPKTDSNAWRLELVPTKDTRRFEISLQLDGQTNAGRNVVVDTAPLVMLVPEVTAPDPVIIEKEGETIIKEVSLDMKSSSIWGIALVLVVFNLVLAVVVYLGYKIYKQQKSNQLQNMTNSLKG